jgi:predicted deacylase
MLPLTIGTATAKPGEITYGWFDAVSHPTGEMDRFPVIIAQGVQADGPVMWITSGIHGDEHTGPVVISHLITPELVASLRGTLIAIPALNPAGLRVKQRSPYYLPDSDPNRLFPKLDRKPPDKADPDEGPPSDLELAYQRLYDAILASQPVCLIDLHNAWYGSIPFVFRDVVFYHKARSKGITRPQAQALLARMNEMLDAFGFTIINEFAAESYLTKNLHRSVSGAVLNAGGIPAVTVELGSHLHIDSGIVEACCAGLRNVMRWAGLLSGEHEPVEGIPVIQPGYPVRRHVHPYAPQAGFVHFLARAGEMVQKGQPLARLTDVFGRPVGNDNGLLRSEYDGFVIGWYHGIVRYQGEAVMCLAIRDESDLLVPYKD